ncbi:retropepsin-like aspartic protease [Ramlibacter sp. PS4R-6]|uniref:retropepsin-like aspartic protease n=1 Tax=Ramlibacter sp. PS4R-6 TaxID=3133438 RepID=UPI0030AEC85A
MLDFGGRPVVEVTINGKGPFKLIVDTGASVTVLDTSLAADLGLAGTDVEVDELRIGPVVLAKLDVFVAPIARIMRGDDIPRGVLSASAFHGHLVTFDYPARKFFLQRGALPPAESRTVFSYKGDDLPSVPVMVAGKEISVHLDTGAPYALALPTRYLKELPLAGEPVRKGTARTHAGELPIFEATVVGDVTLGEFKLPVRVLRFTDVVPDPHARPRGQVGGEALKDFILTLDASNERLRLARSA